MGLCGYLTHTHTHTACMFPQREGGVVKETLIAAGRNCSSVWLFSLGALCMRERKHSKWHDRERERERERWSLFLLCSASSSNYLLIRLETGELHEAWLLRAYRRKAWRYRRFIRSRWTRQCTSRRQCINKSAITLGGLDFYGFLPPWHTFIYSVLFTFYVPGWCILLS